MRGGIKKRREEEEKEGGRETVGRIVGPTWNSVKSLHSLSRSPKPHRKDEYLFFSSLPRVQVEGHSKLDPRHTSTISLSCGPIRRVL